MSSPFPGMDPYLEDPAYWSDFHYTFINYLSEAIADQLPREYEANLGERQYHVELDPATRKRVYPDVAVADHGANSPPVATRDVASATLEPITIPLDVVEGPRETYVEILHGPERSLVAVLELLSPTNKHEPGRTEYLSKRNALLRQSVHLVELDLLLGGQRLPMGKPLPAADYYYLLSRSEQRFDCQVYRWNLAQQLPRLPVPLRPPHGDMQIDLAQVFTTAYDRGRFRRRLAYHKPCPAPLQPEPRSWVAEIATRSGHPG
jgi:hypothetical protein